MALGANDNSTGNATAEPDLVGDATWLEVARNPFAGISDFALSFLTLIVIILAAYFAVRGIRAVVRRIRKTPPTAASLLGGKFAMLLVMFVVTAFSLNRLFAVDLLSLFATLGIVSLALGFGLQNTVANLAAGVGLSLDRPFEVGDRIRVGDTWGDVASIGLRSTRILTTSGELVAVPNSVLDTQEVWNNTHERDVELRMELLFSITYDSSIPLAESIALRAARRHARVLAYPEPRVQIISLGDHGVHMTLKAWIDQARIRPVVMDRLFRDMLNDFDTEGVLIPFPHEVQVNQSELGTAAPTPEFLEQSEDAPLVLVVTRGAGSAQVMAGPVLDFVKQVGARAIVLHVRSLANRFRHMEADKALNEYMNKAAQKGLKARPRSEVGELTKVVSRVAKEEGVRLVILGQTTHRGKPTGWYKNEVADMTKETNVTVLALQTHLEQAEEFINRWHKRLRPEELEELAEEKPIATEKGDDGEDADIEESRSSG
jgi:small conductance mechanosensitive channel